jgi:sarcosine oxidase subunit beta
MITTLGFYRAGRKSGVKYITGEKVVRIKKSRGVARQIITARGNVYEGGLIILAAGHGSVKIAATVGVHLPIRKIPNEIFVTEKCGPVMPYVVCGVDTPFYGTQTKNGSLVFGYGEMQTMQLFQSTPRDNPATTHEIISATARGFADIFPGFAGMKVIRSWCGWIDDSMDHVAIISPVDEVPGLIVACGFSGHGFGIGPGVGYVLAELAAGKPTSVDLSELRYDRFKAMSVDAAIKGH